jgi:hypothetical protein
MNQRPTPNFDRESSLIANRRWFDQPLGDQNLDTLQDGRYGLIAGTTTENYQLESQMPDNDYVEPIRRVCRMSYLIIFFFFYFHRKIEAIVQYHN